IMRRGGTKVIHVNFTSARVDEIYFPQHEVIGDIAQAVRRLGEKIGAQPHWDLSYFERVKTEMETHIAENADDARFPLAPQRVVSAVRGVLPEDGVACLDNGMYKLWFTRNFRAYAPNTLLVDNALATMGAGLPSAIAAKMTFADKKVVAVC